jgi:hypothetical protein
LPKRREHVDSLGGTLRKRSGVFHWFMHDQRSIPARPAPMPSLFRFLTIVGVICGLIYGGIYALANFVNPKPREMTISVPPDKFYKK